MGPFISPCGGQLTLRPFQSSTTFGNLQRERRGVFHVTDDVELLAQAAVGKLSSPPEFQRTPSDSAWFLPTACRWLEFEVVEIDDAEDRSVMRARVVHSARLRDFFGLNRAKHAVVEAAILATRVGLIENEDIWAQLRQLTPLVEKTGAVAELRAFAFLQEHLQSVAPASACGEQISSHSSN